MITVYGMSVSGNCHKVRLLPELLGREYHWVAPAGSGSASLQHKGLPRKRGANASSRRVSSARPLLQ